jgi:signal transduction histidine kinase
VDIVEVTSCTIRELRSSSLRDIDIQIAFGEYGCVTLTDRDKLHHVIRELVQNAAEATTDDRSLMIAAGRCTLTEASNSSLPEGEYVFLSVQDNGRGMTHDVARRAFDPLFSTKGGRHGWGLACGAGFVRQCGGDIVLKSVRDVGTTVTVYLPLSKPSAP